ncbi:MAG TPA: hypothetical protein VGT61_10490 [Thermomicrobiales bacterium]|jgi:hypothetical protein|nr:hypothetical protein [Thermomicrobiales bacterium]
MEPGDTSTTTLPFDTLSHDFIALAFGLNRHVDGFIDAYTGPEETRERLTRAEPGTPEGLLEQARALAGQVADADDLDGERRLYLLSQTAAMIAVAERLAGIELSYEEEVERYFGVPATRTPETELDTALAELDDALPGRGTGDLNARMTEWKRQFEVAPETARQLLDVIVPEIRSRTRRLVDLPDDESVRFELVSDKPWSGYNWYLGGARSLVEINTDLPIHVNALTGLVAHEAYPGHHTEHLLKERRLFRERGWGEFAVQLILTPQAVISEGIATLAESIIFPGDEAVRWQVEELYPAAGVSGNVAQQLQVEQAQRALRAVASNAGLMLHAEGRSEDEVVAYLMRYGLRTEESARHQLRFLTDPLWRAYVFTYHAGRDILHDWLHRPGEEPTARFARLLTMPTSPAAIIAETGGA